MVEDLGFRGQRRDVYRGVREENPRKCSPAGIPKLSNLGSPDWARGAFEVGSKHPEAGQASASALLSPEYKPSRLTPTGTDPVFMILPEVLCKIRLSTRIFAL